MRLLFSFLLSCLFFSALAQTSPDADIAKTFMRQGDYTNAVLVLKRALEQNPRDLAIAKDLALCYYFQKENTSGIAVMQPFMDSDLSDDQCYQIMGNLLIGSNLPKEAEKMYKKGLAKFPESGALYNDLGELMWLQQDFSAIKIWEKGIESDPSFPKNYYNAARHYYLSTDKVWCLVYGEIFVNMEPNSQRSAEIKDLLMESYKKLFTDTKLGQTKTKNDFSKAFLLTMQDQAHVSAEGITTESLIMIRTRFILKWSETYAAKFPFKLFEFQRQLLQEGLFEAYNQWLFTSTGNLPAYQNWINTHLPEFTAFDKMQKSRVFRMPAKQYYNN